MKKSLFLILALSAMPFTALATTNVFVHNNTPFPIAVSVTQGGTPLGGQHWSRGVAAIGPGMRETVVRFNRDTGITDGKNFFFDTTLRIEGTALVLKQQLHGSTVGSHLWQAVAGPGFQHPWSDTRDSRNAEWLAGENKLRVLYRAYFTGTDDDIEYIVQSSYAVEEPRADTWRVLAYNIYMRPTSLFKNGQGERADRLPAQLQGYDALVFSEAFDDDERDDLLRGLRGEYPHVSRILGTDEGIEQDGGVIIVSRWPIVAEDQREFNVCGGFDCQSEKGVVYAKIVRNGQPLHIFGSHTQADAENRGIRAQQFQTIKTFIDSKAIPASEPVLIAGDLNVDKRRAPQEFQDMLRTLNAQHPAEIGPKFSFDPASNKLAAQGTPSEYLDYVLWSAGHLRPAESINQVRMLRSFTEWHEVATAGLWELSDHYPVYGRFRFVDPATVQRPFWAKQFVYGVQPSGELVWNLHTIPTNPAAFDAKPVAPSPVIQGQAGQIGSAARRAAMSPANAPPRPQLSRIESPASQNAMDAASQHVTNKWELPKVIGVGWQGFRTVLPAAKASVYALTQNGVLRWFRHDGFADGSVRWKGPVDVGTGWQGFVRIVPAGEGVLYAVTPQGAVRWFRHGDAADTSLPPKWSGPYDVASQWQRYTHVFAAGGGVMYAVQPDGQLMWLKHRGYLSGANDWLGPVPVHSGWAQFKQVFSTGEGVIYGLRPDGVLMMYRHEGFADGSRRWREGIEVARDWNRFQYVFPLLN